MPVVFIATRNSQYEKVVSNIEEVRSRGGHVIAVATEGDLGLTVTASECWGSDFQTSYWTDSIGFGEATGEETDCVFSEAEYASEASFSFSD